MKGLPSILALVVALSGLGCSTKSCQSKEQTSSESEPTSSMKSVGDFESIEDEEARSKAIFDEIGKALLHPRCVNCHPAGNEPLQGDEMVPHQPMVVRGQGGFGAPGMQCSSCHGQQNYRNVPGSPAWHLAPASMAWEGKSLREICEQIKDPERNGSMTLDEIVTHMAEDPLVAYGWNPPDHLEPVPGNQETLGNLTRAWVEAGAHCP